MSRYKIVNRLPEDSEPEESTMGRCSWCKLPTPLTELKSFLNSPMCGECRTKNKVPEVS